MTASQDDLSINQWPQTWPQTSITKEYIGPTHMIKSLWQGLTGVLPWEGKSVKALMGDKFSIQKYYESFILTVEIQYELQTHWEMFSMDENALLTPDEGNLIDSNAYMRTTLSIWSIPRLKTISLTEWISDKANEIQINAAWCMDKYCA